MNLTKDIKAILRGAEPVIYRSTCPESPDILVVLYEYSGQPPNDMDTEFCVLSLQAVTRDIDFDAGLARAQRVAAILNGIGGRNSPNGVEVDKTLYLKISALQHPYKQKEDDAGRIYFAQNFRVWARSTE